MEQKWRLCGERNPGNGIKLDKSGTKWLVHQDTPHSVRQRKGQLVRLGIAQADRQTSLWVSVDEQDFLSGMRQADSKIGTSSGFANAALLVGDGDDLRVH